MKTVLLSAIVALSASAVLAQAPAANANAGGANRGAGNIANRMGPMLGGGDQLDMLNRMLQDPAAMQANLGVTDEQVAKLRQLLADVDAKIRTVDESIQKLGLEQANVFTKALAEKDGKASEEELLALTDKIGKATVERARLRIQRLLVLKQVLTPEQVEKAAALVKERAARQEEINKAFAAGDMETVQRLFNEMRQQGGGFGGGFGRGGNAPAGGNNPPAGGGRQGGQGGPRNNRGGGQGGQGQQGQGGGNNAGGNNANAPAPQGWN